MAPAAGAPGGAVVELYLPEAKAPAPGQSLLELAPIAQHLLLADDAAAPPAIMTMDLSPLLPRGGVAAALDAEGRGALLDRASDGRSIEPIRNRWERCERYRDARIAISSDDVALLIAAVEDVG